MNKNITKDTCQTRIKQQGGPCCLIIPKKAYFAYIYLHFWWFEGIIARTMAEKKVVEKTKTTPKKEVKKTAPKKQEKTSEKTSEFAVIQTGGKQYVVSVGDILTIEKLPEDHKEGDKVTFDKVLLVDNGKDTTTVGTPYIKGAKVTASFEEVGKAKKIDVIRFKSKSRYFKKYGHRQPYNKVRIEALK